MTISVWPVNAVSGAPAYSGRMLRQSLVAPLAVLGSTARPLGGLSGVRSGTPTTTVTATSTTWTCKPHAGILDVESAAEAGPYGYAVDANVTGAVTAANASNARVDLLYAKLSDPAESDGSSVPQVEILYLAGTASATPSAPATPARGSALAWINVPVSGGGSPTVTWVAPGVTPGDVQFQTKALLDLWTTAAPNQRARVINDPTLGNNIEYTSDGTSWLGGWIDATSLLTASWASYQPTTWGKISYRRVGVWVELMGNAQFTAGSNATIFVLPVGFRPAFFKGFVTDRGGTHATINVAADGTVSTTFVTTVGQTFMLSSVHFMVG